MKDSYELKGIHLNHNHLQRSGRRTKSEVDKINAQQKSAHKIKPKSKSKLKTKK